MPATLTERLARLKNYRTRYELAMIRGDEKILIAYSSGRARRDVYAAICDQKRRDQIIAKAGDDIYFEKRKSDGARMGDWKINFTGRTQREAYIEGELPYIGDL